MRRALLTATFVLAAAVSLGACGGSSKVTKVWATSEEVAVNHTPAQRQAADNLAQNTCSDYNRRARLRNRHDQYATMDQFGIYDCIPR